MDNDDLRLLIQGLVDYAEPEQCYSTYPPKLQRAMNRLSLHLMASYPKTVSELFVLFTSPLRAWWPGDVPEGIKWTGTSLDG